MKKIIRAGVYLDSAEKIRATENLSKFRTDRLINLSKTESQVAEFLSDFYSQHGEAPSLQLIYDHFEQGNNHEAVTLIEEITAETFYEGASFDNLFEVEVEDQASQSLTHICKEAIKIATQGMTLNRVTVKGTDEAIAHLFASVRGTPQDNTGKLSSSMKDNVQALQTLYEERKSNPNQSYGIYTGYGLFDQSTAGIRKKQFYLHAGFGGHLKSTLMFNMILNASTAGWNPLLFTSEMPAEDVQQLLICIHSADPKFNGTGKPLPSFRLLLGALTDEEEAFYKTVKDDLINNPQHGTIRVIDSGDFTTFGSVMQRTVREHVDAEVDILWVDYITRLPLDSKYRGVDITTARNETLADAKRFSMSFDRAEGLPVCSPFQINREGYKKGKTQDGKLDKCSRKGTPVLTPTGWVKIEDLREGDRVTGRNGLPTKILGAYNPGVKEIYRISFNDRTSTEVCGDHIWRVRDNRESKNTWQDLTTKDLIERGYSRKDNRESIYSIPQVDPVQFTPSDLPLNPYLLGLLIGSGHLKDNTPLICDDGTLGPDFIETVRLLLPEGVTLRKRKEHRGVNTYSLCGSPRGTNPLTHILEDLGLTGKSSLKKRIPESYLRASINDRRSLLEGLMDIDGNVKSDPIIYNTSSKDLAKGFLDLVRGLGAHATLLSSRNAPRETYRIRFSMSDGSKVTRSKQDLKRRSPRLRTIRSIEETGRDEVHCILVEDPEHLYVVEDYIVTHNTSLGMYNAAEKEADIITYIFYDDDEAATSEPKIGIMKSRWGKVPPDPINVFIEPDSRRIFDLTAGLNVQTGYAPTVGAAAEDEVEL